MAEIVDFGLQQHKIKMDSRYFENVLSVVAGDTGRRLEVQLLDTNRMVQNTTGLNLRLNAEIAGKATYTDANLVDAATGKYQLDLSNGMFLAPGNWQFQWQITDSAGKKLHSFTFTGNVGKNISEGGSQATNFYLNLEDLKAMQDDLVNGTIDSSILETNITEKLTNLETQYAPKLTEVTAQLGQTYRSDVYVPKAETNTKAIFVENGEIVVITPKNNKKGFLSMRLKEGVVTTSGSVGGSGQLFRCQEVLNVPECLVIQQKGFAVSDSAIWSTYAANYISDKKNSQGSNLYRPVTYNNIVTKTAGAWIQYNVNIPKGVNEIRALIYKSSSSSTNVEISVDGDNVLIAQNFVGTGNFETIVIPVSEGSHVIRFTTITAQFMTIAGVLLQNLSEYNDGLNADTVIPFINPENPYINVKGAMEYAIIDADTALWVGSYHGGETRSRLLILVDGTPYEMGNSAKIGRVIEIEQDTNIINKLNAYSRQRFESDGSIEHETIFEGQMNVTRLFTNMSTTNEKFDDIIYPVHETLVNEGNHYLPSGINYVIQRNPSTNQKAITILNNNMFPLGKSPKPYVKKTVGNYNKVYNANIDSPDSPVDFRGGNFRTVHIFE